ncbi:MAG: hypothetical protein NC489_08405 [Ruminococcus flavefaciens]|nr:hypothetical protein [Ruminococcus flavefaciens]
MAIVKYRLQKIEADESANTIHLETSADMVLRENGKTVEESFDDYLPTTGGTLTGKVSLTEDAGFAPVGNFAFMSNLSTHLTAGGWISKYKYLGSSSVPDVYVSGSVDDDGNSTAAVTGSRMPSGNSLAKLRIADPTLDSHAATKEYADGVGAHMCQVMEDIYNDTDYSFGGYIGGADKNTQYTTIVTGDTNKQSCLVYSFIGRPNTGIVMVQGVLFVKVLTVFGGYGGYGAAARVTYNKIQQLILDKVSNRGFQYTHQIQFSYLVSSGTIYNITKDKMVGYVQMVNASQFVHHWICSNPIAVNDILMIVM